MKTHTVLGTLIALALSTASLFAADYKIGDLELTAPYARATLPGAPVSGGYLTIRNTGQSADRLVGGAADFAGKLEIHEMMMDGEVMKMREVDSGLEIPAGGEVVLKPGGYHIMFMKLEGQMKEGEKRAATLTFENAGDVTVEFDVKHIKPGQMHHGAMKHE